MKHNYHERRENRIEFAKLQAAKHEKLSTDYYVRSSQMASVIPFGQPILVGHHSEKGDRRYRSRIHNLMGKSVEAGQTARYYEDKAESIENNTAISSDNPDAIDLLKKKLEGLVTLQEFMKAANKCVKMKDREKGKAAFLNLAGAKEARWNELITPDYARRIGFAAYQLSNNNANIRNVKLRIEKLERLEKREARDVLVKGIRIFENKEANRLQILFGDIPPKEIREKLSKHGFRWCRTEIAWQRHISNWAFYDAQNIVNSIPDDVATGILTPADRLP